MTRAPSVADVFDQLREPLELEAVQLDRARARSLPPDGALPALVGHLNLIQPNHIQILGPTELRYWNEQSDTERNHLLGQLFREDLYGIIVSDGLAVPTDIAARARHEATPLLCAGSSCERIVSTLRHELGRKLTARTVLHGVFLDVLGIGTLLTGASDVGKSELALELIARGHSLVADDAPEFSRSAPGAVEGECPAVIQDFLQISGMGVLNIRAMYGDAAVRSHKQLQLIVRMQSLTPQQRTDRDRLGGNLDSTEVLDVTIPTMTLPIAPGRNLAVMVEAAVRNYMLIQRGYSAGDDLIERQRSAIARDDSCD